MEILHSKYIVSFHYLSSVLHEPFKFPYHTLGSAKAQALQEVVDTVLQKGTMELINHPGQGCYSQLFLVHKLWGGGHPVIYLSSLESEHRCHPYHIQGGNGFFDVWVDQERGLHVLNQPQGRLLPDFHFSKLLALSLDCTHSKVCQLRALVFWPFYSSPGLN